MVRALNTIIEADSSDDDTTCSTGSASTSADSREVRVLTLAKILPDFDSSRESWNEEALCEPDSELDPGCSEALACEASAETPRYIPTPLQSVDEARSTEHRKRYPSLIDQARISQQKSQLPLRHGVKQYPSLIDQARMNQEKKQPQVQHDIEPAHIWFSDLSADWSRYITKPIAKVSLDSMLASNAMEEESNVEEATICTKSKRIRKKKKSLIDKAASQQRDELMELHKALAASLESPKFKYWKL